MAKRSLSSTPGTTGSPVPAFVLSVALAALSVGGCAKTGEPQPPAVRIPRPSADLAARQISDAVVLSISMPTQNVDGSAATTLRQVDVYRLAEDESGGGSLALPEEEYLKRAVRILSIPVSRFSDYLHDKTFRIEDRPSAPKASVKDSTAFRYAVLFVNKRNQAAGFSNQAVIRPVSIPSPPTVISAEVAQDLIRLKWLPPSENMDGSRPARIAGYNIYRSEDPSRFSSTPVNPEPVLVPAYDDRDFQFDKTYHYAVSVVGSVINPYAESHLSDVFSTVTRDIFPPLPPQEFTAIANGDNVVLLWGASESPDVAGYRVYRVEEGATAGQPLQNELITALSCRDLRSGGKGRYSIVAVDTHGNESAPVLTAVENP